jgi:hypothetical protein
VREIVSVVSSAEKVTVSAVGSFTKNVAVPSAPVVNEFSTTWAVVDEEDSVTNFPAIALLPSDCSSVTVTDPEARCPLAAATEDTIGVVVVTVEAVGETVKLPNVTLALFPVSGVKLVPYAAE